jgi:polysaccharide pyruvyl transferase WcaK-like protein
VLVRDDESRSVLINTGVDAARIAVTADIVLTLQKTDIPPQAENMAANLLGPANGKRRLCLHMSLPEGSEDKIRRLLEVVASVLGSRDDIEPLFLFDHGEANFSTIQKLSQDLFRNSRVVRKQSHWVTAALIGMMDAVVTTKLHVGIAAWALGVPPCAIATHAKTERLYKQIGREDYFRKFGQNEDDIREWMIFFADNNPKLSKEIPGRREQLSGLARVNCEKIADFIASHGDAGLISI